MSQFNLENYRTEKQHIIDLIKQTLPDWESTQGFIADGIINPERYVREPVKIACFFSESYGWAEMKRVTDIELQQRFMERPDWWDIVGVGNSKVRVTNRILSCLSCLYKSIEIGEQVSFQQFHSKRLFRFSQSNKELLHHVLQKIAWVNVKKQSRAKGSGTREDYRDVFGHVTEKNRDILNRQIKSMAPDILLVCSNAAYDGLREIGALGNVSSHGHKNTVQQNSDGQFILHLDHPSLWRSYKRTYANFELIYRSTPNPIGVRLNPIGVGHSN